MKSQLRNLALTFVLSTLIVVMRALSRVVPQTRSVVISAFPETEGTFVNHARRVQRLGQALAPPGEARSGVEWLADLLESLTGERVARRPREVLKSIATEVPAFAGISYERLGPLGAALGSG